MKNQNLYLDNASSTFVLPEVVEIMNNRLKEFYGSSTGIHQFSVKKYAEIEKSRRIISKLINCESENLIFTSGGTEANNMAILGTIRKNKIRTAITSPIEHPSVIKPLQYLENQNLIKLHFLKIDENANISLTELEEILKENENSFVSLSHSNYLTGNLLPVKKVTQICKNFNSFFHSDVVQSLAYLKNDFSAMGMDIATASSNKFHGPHGVGFIYMKDGVEIENLMFGEKNEFGFRPGAENISGIAGMTKALEIMQFNLTENFQKCKKIKYQFIETLKNKNIDFEIIGNSENNCLPNILNINFLQEKNSETILQLLDINNISASSGNIKILKKNNSVRFSFSFMTSIEEIQEIDFKKIK